VKRVGIVTGSLQLWDTEPLCRYSQGILQFWNNQHTWNDYDASQNGSHNPRTMNTIGNECKIPPAWHTKHHYWLFTLSPFWNFPRVPYPINIHSRVGSSDVASSPYLPNGERHLFICSFNSHAKVGRDQPADPRGSKRKMFSVSCLVCEQTPLSRFMSLCAQPNEKVIRQRSIWSGLENGWHVLEIFPAKGYMLTLAGNGPFNFFFSSFR